MTAAVAAFMMTGGVVLCAPSASATPAPTSPDTVYLWKGSTGCDASAYFTSSSSGSGTHITSISGDPGDVVEIHNKCGMNVTIEYANEAIGVNDTVSAGESTVSTIHFAETYIPFLVSGVVLNLYVTGSNSTSEPVGADGKAMNTPTSTPTFAGLHAVKRNGTAVLLQGPVVLASGQTAKPRVTFARASNRSPIKKSGSVSVTKSGKVIVRMTAKKPTLVTLSLSAPSSGAYAPYRGGTTWLVK